MQTKPTPSPVNPYVRRPRRFGTPRPRVSPWSPPPRRTGRAEDLSWLARHGVTLGVVAFVLIRFYLRRQEQTGPETTGDKPVSLGLSGAPLSRAREDPLASIGRLREAIAARPSELSLRQELSRLLIESGRAREALSLQRESVRLAPADPGVHLLQGHALAAVCQWQEALASLDEALRLDGELPEAHEARGDVLAEMHWSPGGPVASEAIAAWTEAARLYQKQLEVDPSDAGLRARLGGVLVESGQADAGLAELRRAAQERPGDAFVQACLAGALDDLGRAEEAEAQYRLAAAAQRRLTQANPRHAGHHARLAELLNEAGDEGDDEAWLDALLLDPDYPGVAEIALEHGDEAGETLVSAAQHLAARRWQEAAESFRATLEQWPPVAAHALCGLGEALAHLGQPAAARKALERALALRPGCWRPQEGLVQLGNAD